MSCPSAGKAVGSGEGLIHSTGLQKPSSFQFFSSAVAVVCRRSFFLCRFISQHSAFSIPVHAKSHGHPSHAFQRCAPRLHCLLYTSSEPTRLLSISYAVFCL